MSDPVGERLRSYYQSIEGDPPSGLETRVARALDSAPMSLAATARTPWRPTSTTFSRSTQATYRSFSRGQLHNSLPSSKFKQ